MLQKKIAVINDFSGYGRCSITVSLPIISAMGMQCCPVPTAIFSNHTGYDSFAWTDYTAQMDAYIAQWKQLQLQFAGIATGFLGSAAQIAIVESFFAHFKQHDTVVLVDPVMGDDGVLYSTYTPDLAQNMVRLLPFADIITPNLTEACILTNTPYQPNMSVSQLKTICQLLSAHGPQKIVISGIHCGDYIGNFIYQSKKSAKLLRTVKIGTTRSGTGDVFASVLMAHAVQGVDFQTSVEIASDFISKTIQHTLQANHDPRDGICFEPFLSDLIGGLHEHT